MAKTRREFIALTAAGTIGLATPLPALGDFIFNSQDSELNISIFSKHLQFLNYEDTCDAAKEIGFDSIDLTLRPKGHVLPENVEDDLPKVIDALKKYNMVPIMLSSNVDDATRPQDRKVVETAAKLGFKYYRPAWYKYGNADNITELVTEFSRKLMALSELNKSL